VYATIIYELHSGIEVVPIFLSLRDVPSQGSQDGSIITFYQAIGLGMIGGRKDFLYSQFRADGFEKLSSKLRTVFG
jgi:hypothetical protein